MSVNWGEMPPRKRAPEPGLPLWHKKILAEMSRPRIVDKYFPKG